MLSSSLSRIKIFSDRKVYCKLLPHNYDKFLEISIKSKIYLTSKCYNDMCEV